jgi:hypothetical protein
LPALSTANVRELLKAVLPLPQLTPAEAMDLVITHLINRARSTSSRLKSQVNKPRHNYHYVCAELMRLYYRWYELAL